MLSSFFLARLFSSSSSLSSAGLSETPCVRGVRRTVMRGAAFGDVNRCPKRASSGPGTAVGSVSGRWLVRSDLRMEGRRETRVLGRRGPGLCGLGRALGPLAGPRRRMRSESADGETFMSTSSTTESGLPERAILARLIGTAPSGMYSGTTRVSAPWYSGSRVAASTTSDRTPKSPLISSNSVT